MVSGKVEIIWTCTVDGQWIYWAVVNEGIRQEKTSQALGSSEMELIHCDKD